MRWEDERYVRVYTRDTGDWAALGWQAQALFLLLLRKADRAGILSTGKSGVRGLAALAGMPLEIVKEAEQILLEDGCIRKTEGGYLIPNYIAAQEAKSSDKARQQKSRETARDIAAARSVTSGDAASQSVTACHVESRQVTTDDAVSRPVTPSRAVPSLAVPTDCPPVVGPPVADDDLPDATDDAELLESPPRPELRLTPPDAPKAARTRKQADPEPEPKGDPRHAPLMAALGAAYAEVLPGQKWDTAGKMGGREAKAVKDLLAKADADPRTAGEKAPAEVLKRWRHALSDRYTRVRYAHKLVEKWGDYATPRFPNGTAAVGGGGTAANVADMPAHVLRRADTHHDTLLAIGDADIPIP